MSTERWAIGIDLGTTHCAMARIDLAGEDARSSIVALDQLVARGQLERHPLLPSFLYLPPESEQPEALPWDPQRAFAVGAYARARAAEVPGRVIASAKSWLCHKSVDRRGPLLPTHAPEGLERLSPVEASWRYLEHLGEIYDAQFSGGRKDHKKAPRFCEQPIVLTVPASFDASARELTVEAATAAGIEQLTLLEEPQAALYAWIEQLGNDWRKQLRAGDIVLCADVGGGTCDFSAIAVCSQDGALQLERMAVGDHILLGGDNMDLALAHFLRQRLADSGSVLDDWQFAALVHAARTAKERLLGDPALGSAPVVIPRRGSKLVGGAIRSEVSQAQLRAIVLDGFFPAVALDAQPAMRARTALTEVGLPYAADPAMTRHLGAFLSRQRAAAGGKGALLHPSCVLFNGGVMKSELLRERLTATLDGWLAADGAPPVRVLAGADVDLAVARGAAAYGRVREGRGIRIRGGTAQAHYVGVESSVPAVPGIEPPLALLCVAPFGIEEGSAVELDSELAVVVGEPVRFRFFGSSVRRQDRAGTRLQRYPEGEITELSPIEVVLPSKGRAAGEVVPVRLRVSLTEVGTLLIEAIAHKPRQAMREHPAPGADERWKVELSVRARGS